MRRALIVDDHPLLRGGIKQLLNNIFPSIEIEEASGEVSLATLCQPHWAFIVLDINLGEQNGLDLLKKVKKKCPETPIVVFSLYAEEHYALRALRAGANAYLSKDRTPQDLVEAIKAILGGGRYYIDASLLSKKPIPPQGSLHLSDRETQVLSLVVKGMSRKEISRILKINEKTVSTYTSRLRVKLGARSVVDLIRYASEEGIID